MDKSRIEKFEKERERLNEIVMRYAGRNIKRFYSIDAGVYEAGALSKKHKELMGLVGSLVLRCDDCITYHIFRCHEEGAIAKEIEEALAIGLVIGGSITIPHLRRALALWDELKGGNK